MGDPLSITASAAGLLSLGIQVCQGLTSYYQAYTDRSENVIKTTRSLESLRSSLQNIETALTGRTFSSADEPIVKQVSDLIESCRGELLTLKNENDKFSDEKQRDDLVSLTKQKFRKIAYPFREGTLLRLRESVDDVRGNILFALAALQLNVANDVKDDLEDAADILATVKNSQVLNQILKWLKAPDPTQNHNNACEKRHPKTGLWLIHNYTFLQWLCSESSVLWMYGTMGCGKTILSSIIIQHIFRLRRSDRTRGIAFYYFDFNDSVKQDSGGLLRSLLLQLSVQLDDQHLELVDLHQRYGSGTSEAPTMALLITLRRIIESFAEVHIIIDALDESPPGRLRDSVLDVLAQIRKWSIKHLHVLVTSRDEPDIRVELEELDAKELLIPSQEVDKDIAKYVQESLHSQRALKKWAKDFDEIERSLSMRANGMFRWVECQFASLKRCRSRIQLEEALRSLPGSLRETYFQIFQRIEKNAVDDVKRILTWLCFAKQPMPLSSINGILAVRTDSDDIYNEDRCYVDVWEILSVCPALVSVDTDESHLESASELEETRESLDPVLRIAHFSVFEYLVSDPSQEFSAIGYQLEKALAHAELARSCITILSEKAYPRKDEEASHIREQLINYCARYWDQHLRDCGESQAERQLACDFLSSGIKYDFWRQLQDNQEEGNITSNISRRLGLVPKQNQRCFDSGSPAFYATKLGLAKTVKELIKMGSADVNEFVVGSLFRAQRDLTLLQTASYHGYAECVQVLLDEGADPNFLPPGSWSALELACCNGHAAVANLLIEYGSTLNTLETANSDYGGATLLHMVCKSGLQDIAAMLLKKGVRSNALDCDSNTPLHLAVLHGHGSIVQLLLENGVDRTIQNKAQRTPLFEAIATLTLHIDLWNSLFYPGALLECDIEGSTALITIAGNPSFEELGGGMEFIDWILENGSELDVQDRNGFTALHLALFNGNFHTAKRLLDHGCCIDIRSREAWLPLHSLASCGRKLEMRRYKDMDFISMIERLSLNGTLLDSPGELGLSPAHLTVMTEIPNFLESFIQAGANYLLLDANISTALDYLIERTGEQGFPIEVYTWILGSQAISNFQEIFGTVEKFVSGNSYIPEDSDKESNIEEDLDGSALKSSPKVPLYCFNPGFKGIDYNRRVLLQIFDPVACKALLGMILIYVTMANEDSSLIDMVFQHRETFEISTERFSAITLSSQLYHLCRSLTLSKELPPEVTNAPTLQEQWKIAKYLQALHSKDDDMIKSLSMDAPSLVEIETLLSEYRVSIWSFAFAFNDIPYRTTLIENFLNKGADVNKQDWEGNTVLGIAVGLGRIGELTFNLADNIDTVKLLVRRGANGEIKNKYGRTAIEHAREVSDDLVAAILGTEKSEVSDLAS